MIKTCKNLYSNICIFKFKRVLFIFLLLILTPIFFAVIDFKYSTKINDSFYIYYLFLVTNIANVPFTIITSLVFTIILLFIYKSNLKNMIILSIFVNLVVLSSQSIVYFTKNIVKEPRPYVDLLVENNYINSSDEFYLLDKNKRIEFIESINLKDINIPSWQQKYFTKEIGYSFPSGHTVFIATWTILLFCLLIEKRRYFLAFCICCLAFFIEISRLLLGMHFWHDIFISCCVSFFTVLFFVWVINIFQSNKQKEI
ncbi:phosphatase PAP2 family protein [Arcobacter sp. CECT 9188]|uniref:phosphatase PAP2 family protein n=1 Tax=Arcobacter sp. CECT 9188 TaxID=2044505 RepID=UPI002159F1B0|nr:phosphatase PAP2 family protein [Arcobacter sp. CECT 9188]